MASTVDICNQALIALGARTINSLDEAGESARLCKAKYDWVRDCVLRDHPWNCAKKRARLAARDEAPVFGWGYGYPLPGDCLRVMDVFAGDGSSRLAPQQGWIVEGRDVLCDEPPPLSVLYVARITDPTLFEPLLGEAVAARLAAELAEAFSQSTSQTGLLFDMYEARLREARTANAQEGYQGAIRGSTWLDARR